MSLYDYSKHRYLSSPHNPQWSFVQSKCCDRLDEAYYNCDHDIWPGKPDDYRCKPQCNKCKTICEFNDYIRGVAPMDKPHYPVPALIGVGNSTDLYTICWFIQGWYGDRYSEYEYDRYSQYD